MKDVYSFFSKNYGKKTKNNTLSSNYYDNNLVYTMNFGEKIQVVITSNYKHYVPFMPTEVPPADTAAKAYSIWTNLPEGLIENTND